MTSSEGNAERNQRPWPRAPPRHRAGPAASLGTPQWFWQATRVVLAGLGDAWFSVRSQTRVWQRWIVWPTEKAETKEREEQSEGLQCYRTKITGSERFRDKV